MDSKPHIVQPIQHGPGKFRVVRHGYSLLLLSVEPIHQKAARAVHVRSLLLQVSDQDVRRETGYSLNRKTALDGRPEGAVGGIEAR